MKILLFILTGIVFFSFFAEAQDEEKILYYQMEPYDDSLFINIQKEMLIEPADPKAEIIVDLRDTKNQTIQIKNLIYPMLALSAELRAKIETYPWKLDLEQGINYGSVFTRVLGKIKLNNVVEPPSKVMISPTLEYINPFIQVFGGERTGVELKNDIGISFGFGTPYSGVSESNFIEANFHILGFAAGIYTTLEELISYKIYTEGNQQSLILATRGFQLKYNIPFGNFLQIGYLKSWTPVQKFQREFWNTFDTLGYHPLIIEGEYFNFEVRYPVRVFGSTRARLYGARYLNELHFGFAGRELSLAGSTFDFRFDAMTKSDTRAPQYVVDVMVQKIFNGWGFSSLAIGPSAVFSRGENQKFGIISFLLNARFKLGTSL